ncbi:MULTISPECIES: hypothetical protein [Halobellus]|uniref:hypothetical protein n=1 Tax=Halobellus TaxID=1073986 RepID=UPI00210D1EC7|nr:MULTISPECIES: hypothetical protein [Halobellus]MDQ2053308.1 hypothetical protein [Halobellus sp. H-GB7]
MSKTCRPSPSSADPEWNVRQVVPRSEWDTTTEACPTCGEPVELCGPHYQVELDRERAAAAGSKLTRERRLLSFCDESCATSWLDDVESR